MAAGLFRRLPKKPTRTALSRLLRVRRERPRGSRAAEQRDELASM